MKIGSNFPTHGGNLFEEARRLGVEVDQILDASASMVIICLKQVGNSMQAQEMQMQQMNSEKDWVITLILAILVGSLGIDRFYSGSILLGVLKLFTLGGLGLWWLVDLIMLVTGNYKDGNGNPIASK